MILTAPAMIAGNTRYDAGNGSSRHAETHTRFSTTNVIKRFVDRPTVIAMRAFPLENAASFASSSEAISLLNAAIATAASATAANNIVADRPVTAVANNVGMDRPIEAKAAEAKTAEVRTVIKQATFLYAAMDLQDCGLDPKAFEYAWRGYHNLVKKGLIHRKTVLSICDFSQSSRNKRMYVIDVQHRKLLYRTYVAHGQNSGDEFANDFSNDADSYKSSLGFYITQTTYIGRNGLSLRLNGIDGGYNDQAMKRQIVLHGSSYVGEKYMQDYGNLGTSLGCPALPIGISGRIIRAVKNGSCLFIYHATPQYLENSTIIHG